MDGQTSTDVPHGTAANERWRALQQCRAGHQPHRGDGVLESEHSLLQRGSGAALLQTLMAAQGLAVGAIAPAALVVTDLDDLVQCMLANDGAAVSRVVAAARAQGLALETMCDTLLAPAAARLGELWEQDRCDFVQVTLALWCLHRVFREQAGDFHSDLDSPGSGLQALLVPAPGESHTLGLTMAVEFFRRAGWEVLGAPPASTDEMTDLVRDAWFDVVGLSASCDARIDWLGACIQAVRAASRNPDVVVLVGGALFVQQPGLAASLGADLAVPRGAEGPAAAAQLLAQRPRRRATG